MTISEKAAYIKGLADGCGLDTESSEGKILSAIIDLLGDVGEAISEIEENEMNIGDELDALSDDLADVEDVVYGDDDEDEYDYCDCDDDCDCCDDTMVSVECPSCGEEIVLDESILDAGTFQCPNCGETLELEYDEEDEEPEDVD